MQMFDSNAKGAMNVISIGKISNWAWSQNAEWHLQFDMEITYQSSYSYTPNMNSQKINTNIIFIPSLFLGHWDLTLTLPGQTYIDIHTRLAWIRGGILQTIMSLDIEKFIYWYSTGFRISRVIAGGLAISPLPSFEKFDVDPHFLVFVFSMHRGVCWWSFHWKSRRGSQSGKAAAVMCHSSTLVCWSLCEFSWPDYSCCVNFFDGLVKN